MQERRNSIANALELRISCTNPTNELMQERRNSIASLLREINGRVWNRCPQTSTVNFGTCICMNYGVKCN